MIATETIKIEEVPFGVGESTKLVTLQNEQIVVELISYGAHLYRLFSKDKFGKWDNIVLNITPYENLKTDWQWFGATVGPIAGRIKDGTVGGFNYPINDHNNSLHSGSNGWSWQEWDIEKTYEQDGVLGVVFRYEDTTENSMTTWLVVELCGNELSMIFKASAEEERLFNPTNHAYFNLAGVGGNQGIHNQKLTLASSEIFETDEELIPTGNTVPVANTPYDFQEGKLLKDALSELENGLDTPFKVTQTSPQLVLEDEETGRKLSIISDRETVVLHSLSNYTQHTEVDGKKVESEFGLAIEFQEVPNTQPNSTYWQDILVQPGVVKSKHITYKVDTIKE